MKRSLFSELRRRNVFRAVALYIGAVWAFGQGLSQFSPALGLPDWATRWFLLAAAVGFPFWIAFAWLYEFTPEGLKRESEVEPHESIRHHTGRKLDVAIIATLAIAVVLLVTDRFVLHHGVNAQTDVDVSAQSIAVLPFVNMSSDKEQEYFSDGISEELLNLLTKIQALHVAARTSSFSFKGKDTPIPDIARVLHVANVLEGSVRKSGDQVRITAQLIRAADGYHVWSQTWDRKLDDIFKIQDEIAGIVTRRLEVTLLGAAPKVRTTDPRAYALYLQAKELARQNNADAYRKSDDLYRQVLAIDPNYVPAWIGQTDNFGGEAGVGLLSFEEALSRGRDAVQKALAIDPDYAPAHVELGYIAVEDNDLAGAARHIEHALALDPTNLDVLLGARYLLRCLGRLDEALALSEMVVRRDPVNVDALTTLGSDQVLAGRYDAAIATSRTVLNLSPGRGDKHFSLGMTLLLKGDATAALAEIEQEPNETMRMVGLPIAYFALGRKADSDQALAALIAKYEKDWSYNIAGVYAFRGESDKAFEWLDKAVENKDGGITETATDPTFAKIRADPRWLPFLRKVGMAPEQLAKIEFKVTLPAAEASAASGLAHP